MSRDWDAVTYHRVSPPHQCGGFTNIDALRSTAERIAFTAEPFGPYFRDWVRPWNCATRG